VRVHIVEGLAYREVFAEHLDGVTLYLNQEVPPCGQESQDKKNSKDGSWMLYIDQGYPSEYPVEQVIAISGGVLRAGLFLAKGEKNRHHNRKAVAVVRVVSRQGRPTIVRVFVIASFRPRPLCC
jgi:hypothetical protein